MVTLEELINITNEFKPVLFVNAERLSADSLKITRFAGVRRISFTAHTVDKIKTGNVRVSQIHFIIPKGENVNTYIPDIRTDRVLVRSASPWYKYAFGYNNQRVKAHFGTLSKFTVKGTGGSINPRDYPGLDKHLLFLTKYLMRTNRIKQ